MNLNFEKLKHITKLDPDKSISKKQIGRLIDAGTDAIMISGTQNITKNKVLSMINTLKDYDVLKILEPVSPASIVYEGIDYIFVPYIFNTKSREWNIERHLRWSRAHEEKIQEMKDRIFPEAYIVLNQNSAVAKLTQAITDLTTKEVEGYSLAAEFLGTIIIYLEYSGAYGNINLVKTVSDSLKESVKSNKVRKSRLLYGGNINSREKAQEMLKYADTIVIGNVVYEDPEKALETIAR